MSKTDFDATFVDAEGKRWNCVITTAVMAQFCREQGLRLDQVSPETLDFWQTCKLGFLSIRHHTEMKRQDFEDFLETMVQGEAIDSIHMAVASAIVNFTLPRLKDTDRVKMIDAVKQAGLGVAQHTDTDATD